MTQQFYMVVSSLPRLNASYKIQETFISRLQLEKRLKLLPNEHIAMLKLIESLVWTSWFNPQEKVSETRKNYQIAQQINSTMIHETIDWYLNLRSILAALRMRQAKKSPPENPQEYWITHLSRPLLKHWDELDFGLKSIYPWVPKIASDLEKQDTAAIEEFLLSYLWNYLSVIERGHYFDLEAIVIYLLRWNIAHYWSTFNKVNAFTHLDELAHELLCATHLPEGISFKKMGVCDEK